MIVGNGARPRGGPAEGPPEAHEGVPRPPPALLQGRRQGHLACLT